MTDPTHLPELPDDLIAAAYLEPGHPDRRAAQTRAAALSPQLLAAFNATCQESDALRDLANDIDLPPNLASSLLALPHESLAITPSPKPKSRFHFPTAFAAIAALMLIAVTFIISLRSSPPNTLPESARALALLATQHLPATSLTPTTLPTELLPNKEAELAAQIKNFPAKILQPLGGFALAQTGITTLNGKTAAYATYAAPEGQYTVFQVASADFNLPPTYPYSSLASGNLAIDIWPGMKGACAWIRVAPASLNIRRQQEY